MTYTDSVDAARGVRMVKTDHTTTPKPRMSLAVNLVARYPPQMLVTVYPTKKTLQETVSGWRHAGTLRDMWQALHASSSVSALTGDIAPDV